MSLQSTQIEVLSFLSKLKCSENHIVEMFGSFEAIALFALRGKGLRDVKTFFEGPLVSRTDVLRFIYFESKKDGCV